jgi:hypothetical protein
MKRRANSLLLSPKGSSTYLKTNALTRIVPATASDIELRILPSAQKDGHRRKHRKCTAARQRVRAPLGERRYQTAQEIAGEASKNFRKTGDVLAAEG